jgi:uncharacterized membrane protein
MPEPARFVGHSLPVVALTLAAVLAVAAPAAAHQHHRAAPAETVSSVPRDSAAAGTAGEVSSKAADTTAAPFVMPPVREALLEHMHNKLVHFPFALGLAAAMLLVLGRRRPELDLAGRWLVRLAAAGGIAAYFTGRIQEEAFDGEPKEWLVHLHENWGLTTAIVLVVWALLTLWKPAQKHAWLLGLVVAALVLITAFYGGIVAHGE